MDFGKQSIEFFTAVFILVFCVINIHAQNASHPSRQDTLKGSVTPERAWWNVLHYDLTIELNIAQKKIQGNNTITFEVTKPQSNHQMQIDLQDPLHIDSVLLAGIKLSVVKYGQMWMITVPRLVEKENVLTVHYSGTPKESFKPPYDGGIIWAKDSLNRTWISVACQMVGASVWFPCKDHNSDEPDRGASLTVIVPDSLTVVGNGKLIKKVKKNNKYSYTWAVVNPISAYGLSFYVGHYVAIDQTYSGEKGHLPMSYWVLDYNRQKAVDHMIPEVIKTMRAFEKWFGPYPFYEDGFKMVEAPYIGMEHQSAIAYGNKFKKGRFTFKNLTALDFQTDRLIVHEMAHEWFGNNITMNDIGDRWVQEGFAAYGEELFIEELLGREAGREFFLTRQRNFIKNITPLISSYGIFKDAGPDMYFKGWAIVHMLREIVNDDVAFKSLSRSLNQKFYHQTVWSTDLEHFISELTGMDLNNFFDQYLRHAALPLLEYHIENNRLAYRLVANVPLEMPIKIVADKDFWIQGTSEWQHMDITETNLKMGFVVDPNFLIGVRKVDSIAKNKD